MVEGDGKTSLYPGGGFGGRPSDPVGILTEGKTTSGLFITAEELLTGSYNKKLSGVVAH